MNKLIYVLFGISIVFLASCEQKEIDPGKTNTTALSGEWFVTYDHNYYGPDPFAVGYTRIITANTAADDGQEMILDDEENFWAYRVKVPINESNLTFGTSDTLTNLVPDYPIGVIVRNGQIFKDAKTTEAGITTDSIYFEIWFEDLVDATGIPGDTLIVSGYRRTGYTEDEH